MGWIKRIGYYFLLALVVIMSALGFPPPTAPRPAVRPGQEQAEPVKKD